MQRNSPLSLAVSIGLALLLSSCGPLSFPAPVDEVELSPPDLWQAADSSDSRRVSRGWLDDFQSPDLTATVARAMAHNYSLAAAEARMEAARFVRIAGRSRILPQAQLTQSSNLSRSENGPDPRQESESYNLVVSASWEADLWGRLRDLNQADWADLVSARAIFRGARLSLAAATARAWIGLIAAEQQLELAEVTLDSFERNLRISERNYRGTGQGALDVQFGRTNVAAARRTVEVTRLVRDEAARTIEELTGSYPTGKTRAGAKLPVLRSQVPIGLPAGLLERRPDLVQARARLFASARRADAARKQLLPAVALTISGGTPSTRLTDLLDPARLATSIAANLAQNLYRGGQLTADARAAIERNRAALADYQQAALTAFREVESALATEVSLAEQERFLRREVEQAALAEAQSSRDYADGIEGADILDVLEAQRRANNARSSLIRLRGDRLQNRVDLHLALGGDFSTAEN